MLRSFRGKVQKQNPFEMSVMPPSLDSVELNDGVAGLSERHHRVSLGASRAPPLQGKFEMVRIRILISMQTINFQCLQFFVS